MTKITVLGTWTAVLLVAGIAAWLLYFASPDVAEQPASPEPASLAEAVAANRPAAADPTPSSRLRQPSEASTAARLVWGRVVEAGGDGRSAEAPIPGAEVGLFDYATGTELAAQTDASGRFAFPQTRDRAGVFHLAIRHAGHGSPLLVDAPATEQPLVYRLGPGCVLRGRVVEAVAGSPVPRFRIQAVRLPYQQAADFEPHQALLQQLLPHSLRAAAPVDVDDAEGRFELAGLLPGKFALIVDADGYQPTFFNGGGKAYEGDRGVIAKSAAAAEVLRIELLPTGDVYLQVLDRESKEPVFGAELSLVVEVGRWRFPFRQRLDHPDSEGRHRLRVAMRPDRRIDDLALTVAKPGYAPWSGTMSGQEEGHTIVALLGRGGRVRGTVRAEDRSPMSGCVVLVERVVDAEVVAAGHTAADGTYELGSLPAEEDLLLRCFAPSVADVVAAALLRLQEGEVRTVDLGGGGAGAIFGRVTMCGDPLARVLVNIHGTGPGPDTMVYTGSDGRFRVEGLAAAEYQVFFNASGDGRDLFAQRIVTLTAYRSEDVSLAFGAVIRGVVIDADRGAPLDADAQEEIAARRAGASGNREYAATRIGHGGRFALYLAEPAQYELTLLDSNDWYLESAPAVDLRTAGEISGLEVRVRRDAKDGSIHLRIVDDATGQPVADGSYEVNSTRSRGAGSFDAATIEETGCPMGVYHYAIGSDRHAPLPIEVAITPWEKHVEREVRLQRGTAVRVTEVTAGGNAWKSGLEPGDRITAYDGAPILDLAALHAAIASARPDVPVRLSITRRGMPMVLSVAAGGLGIAAATARDG